MQTTLRIDDALYREAKTAAAREGITITRFIEAALLQRLRPARAKVSLPVYDSGVRTAADLMTLIAEADQDRNASEERRFGLTP